MKTVIKCYVHKTASNSWDMPDTPPVFQAFPFDMSEQGYILIGTVDLEYELPADFNPLRAEISGLNKQLDLLAEKYHTSTAAIRNRISTLQCIENSPAGAA